MDFLTIEQLQAVRATMETWSQLCLDGLPQVMSRLELATRPRTTQDVHVDIIGIDSRPAGKHHRTAEDHPTPSR